MEVASVTSHRKENFGSAKVVINNPTSQTSQVRRINMNPRVTSTPSTVVPRFLPPREPQSTPSSDAPSNMPRGRLPRRPLGDNSFYRSETIEKTGRFDTAEKTGRFDAEKTGRFDTAEKTGRFDAEKTGRFDTAEKTGRFDAVEKTGRFDTVEKAPTKPLKKREDSRDSAPQRPAPVQSKIPTVKKQVEGIMLTEEEGKVVLPALKEWATRQRPALERKKDGSLAVGVDLSKEVTVPEPPPGTCDRGL